MHSLKVFRQQKTHFSTGSNLYSQCKEALLDGVINKRNVNTPNIGSNSPLPTPQAAWNNARGAGAPLLSAPVSTDFMRMRFCSEMFQRLTNRWGRKLHMGSTKSTLSVLKALEVRRGDKHRDILGQQQLKGRNAAGWQISQG